MKTLHLARCNRVASALQRERKFLLSKGTVEVAEDGDCWGLMCKLRVQTHKKYFAVGIAPLLFPFLVWNGDYGKYMKYSE